MSKLYLNYLAHSWLRLAPSLQAASIYYVVVVVPIKTKQNNAPRNLTFDEWASLNHIDFELNYIKIDFMFLYSPLKFSFDLAWEFWASLQPVLQMTVKWWMQTRTIRPYGQRIKPSEMKIKLNYKTFFHLGITQYVAIFRYLPLNRCPNAVWRPSWAKQSEWRSDAPNMHSK